MEALANSIFAIAPVVCFGVRRDAEPNNSFAEANPLPLNTSQAGTLFLNPASDTQDWYELTLPAIGNVTFTASYQAGLSGFIYIHNSAGGQLGFASSATGTLTINCTAAGTIYVRATRNGGSGTYTLSVTLNQPQFSADIEPNGDNNVLLSSESILQTFQENQAWTGQLGHTNAGVSDVQDWFYIVSPEDGNVTRQSSQAVRLPGLFISIKRMEP